MKVAIVDPAAYSLPYDDALCTALAAAGMDVTLFTTRFAHGAMPEPNGYRIVEHFYGKKPAAVPRRIARGLQHSADMKRLQQVLHEDGFDVAHLQWSVLPKVDRATWTRIGQDMATVFTVHNAIPRADAGPLDVDTVRLFNAVVSHSEEGAARVRRACNLPENRVWHIVHGALDSYASMAPSEVPPVELGPGPVVSLPGLLRPYKGIDVLLRAWPRVREQLPEAQLLIAGRPMGIELPEQLPEGAHVVPRYLEGPEFAWVLDRSDVVCLPYTSIDNSGVLFAAMATGTPMLLSDVGGFREFIGCGAEFAEPGSAASLMRALVELLGNDLRRRELREEALAAAAGPFAWSNIAAEYAERYASLVERRARSRA